MAPFSKYRRKVMGLFTMTFSLQKLAVRTFNFAPRCTWFVHGMGLNLFSTTKTVLIIGVVGKNSLWD